MAEALSDHDDLDEEMEAGGSEAALPQASVDTLLKEVLNERTPDGGTPPRCSVDVQILMRTCLEEFLQMLTTQAHEVSTKAGKKTICEEHIDVALEQLGFGHYITPDDDAMQGGAEGGAKPKRKAKRKRGAVGAESGLSEEELLREQHKLFAEARQNMQGQQSAAGTSEGGA